MSIQPLDIEQSPDLIAYLRDTHRITKNETPTVRVLTGGVSNRAVLVERSNGESWVLKQSLAKLRVSVDWFSDPARIRREALGLKYLEKLLPPGTITPLVFEDHANDLFAMTAVPEPHENWKTMLLARRVESDHVTQFGALLGALHRRAAESTEPLREIFDDRSFFESLRLEPYYEYTAAQVPAVRDFLLDLVTDTRSRRITLVHGDYSPKNILVRDGRLVLLDHEVIHWGDPAFDVGFAMAHLLSKAHHLIHDRQKFVEAAARFCQTYADALGPVYWDANLEAMCVRQSLGCLLARVAGRSTLEYLDATERERQHDLVVTLMNHPPMTIEELIRLFILGIETHARH